MWKRVREILFKGRTRCSLIIGIDYRAMYRRVSVLKHRLGLVVQGFSRASQQHTGGESVYSPRTPLALGPLLSPPHVLCKAVGKLKGRRASSSTLISCASVGLRCFGSGGGGEVGRGRGGEREEGGGSCTWGSGRKRALLMSHRGPCRPGGQRRWGKLMMMIFSSYPREHVKMQKCSTTPPI